jgi:hypothetical protein
MIPFFGKFCTCFLLKFITSVKKDRKHKKGLWDVPGRLTVKRKMLIDHIELFCHNIIRLSITSGENNDIIRST